MSRTIRTPADLKHLSRDLGLVPAIDGEADVIDSSPRNSAIDRAGAEVMRRNGFSEDEIVEKFGYAPDPIVNQMRKPAA